MTDTADDFLLIKKGYYYRPNNRGYTALKREAGRYTREQAEQKAGETESVCALLASECSSACDSQTRAAEFMRLSVILFLEQTTLTGAELAEAVRAPQGAFDQFSYSTPSRQESK